jgi:hypothetical protein
VRRGAGPVLRGLTAATVGRGLVPHGRFGKRATDSLRGQKCAVVRGDNADPRSGAPSLKVAEELELEDLKGVEVKVGLGRIAALYDRASTLDLYQIHVFGASISEARMRPDLRRTRPASPHGPPRRGGSARAPGTNQPTSQPIV